MKNNKRNSVFVIVSGTVFLALMVIIIVFDTNGFFTSHQITESLFIVALVVIGAIFAVILSMYLTQLASLKSLQLENEYLLGKRSTFNNITMFQNKASIVSKSRKKQSRHVVAFSISNNVISQNINRNAEILKLNDHLVNFLPTLNKRLKLGEDDLIFAFSRGSFLIYAFKQNEVSLKNIINIITEEIYDFATNECPHIWIQPFFGVNAVKNDQSFAQQVENALIARDHSESNFESVTFYQDNFRRGVSSKDIDEISAALNNNEFVVYYQPKFNLETKKFISSEALIRWDSKKYGLLTPTKFLGKAETAGLIHEIDIFVLRKVCEDLNDLRKRGKKLLPVSVNFSLYEFYSANFLDTIVNILDEYKIPTNLIEIEITEATSQANTFLSISIVKKLKEKGMRVLMDDFGIGFSNVGNLRKIPFDALKIDKSFIDYIVDDVKSREIVRFLINLCKVNGLEVIAEGVDNKEQLDILRRNKCDTIQGFYYSKALSKADFEKFLLNNPFEKKEDNAL